MIIWLLAVPLIFIPDLGYYSIVISSAIAFALIGMEAISLEIENPFGKDFNDLPVDKLLANDFEHLKFAYRECEKLPSDTGSDADDLGGKEWGEDKAKPASLSPLLQVDEVLNITPQTSQTTGRTRSNLHV